MSTSASSDKITDSRAQTASQESLEALQKELLTLLRRQMNGAVSHAMTSAGIEYGINYGVSLPTIKEIALPFAPNHELARKLFASEIRELRIASLYIANPSEVTAQELPMWNAHSAHPELKSLVPFILLRRVEL